MTRLLMVLGDGCATAAVFRIAYARQGFPATCQSRASPTSTVLRMKMHEGILNGIVVMK